jgi:hypothetical protein
MALNLTLYKASTGSSVKRASAIVADEAEDGTLRLLDLGYATQYDARVLFEGLTAAQRDTLTDLISANQTNDIIVDLGTRNVTGKLIPGSDGWVAESGLFSVELTLRGTIA